MEEFENRIAHIELVCFLAMLLSYKLLSCLTIILKTLYILGKQKNAATKDSTTLLKHASNDIKVSICFIFALKLMEVGILYIRCSLCRYQFLLFSTNPSYKFQGGRQKISDYREGSELQQEHHFWWRKDKKWFEISNGFWFTRKRYQGMINFESNFAVFRKLNWFLTSYVDLFSYRSLNKLSQPQKLGCSSCKGNSTRSFRISVDYWSSL